MNLGISAAIGVGTALTLLAAPASAAPITGEVVGIAQLFPDMSSVYNDLGDFEVIDGVEVTFNSLAEIDVDGTSVTITAIAGSPVASAGSFNGFQISDALSSFGDFESFSIVDSSLTGATVAFDAENLFLNFDGIGSFVQGDFLTASFTVADDPAPVPLPAAGLLLMAGVGLLGAAGRRRRS